MVVSVNSLGCLEHNTASCLHRERAAEKTKVREGNLYENGELRPPKTSNQLLPSAGKHFTLKQHILEGPYSRNKLVVVILVEPVAICQLHIAQIELHTPTAHPLGTISRIRAQADNQREREGVKGGRKGGGQGQGPSILICPQGQ